MFKDNLLDRINDKRMEYYREVYKNSPRLTSEDLVHNKTIIIYCEQGLGDIIQTARYFEPLKLRSCKIIVHAQEELKELFLAQNYVDGFISKSECNLPQHDFHALSLSLPFLMNGSYLRPHPYIVADTNEEILNDAPKQLKIGITWEGNSHKTNLSHFKQLNKLNAKLYMVQKEIVDEKLLENSQEIELYGTEINNLLDTAKLINALDFLVAVDTCTLHLAGALNKKAYGLIFKESDSRWNRVLYPSVKLFKVKDNIDQIMQTIVKLNDKSIS